MTAADFAEAIIETSARQARADTAVLRHGKFLRMDGSDVVVDLAGGEVTVTTRLDQSYVFSTDQDVLLLQQGYQYVLINPVKSVSDHEAEPDPHPQYLTSAEGNAVVAAHVAAADPHTGYQKESEKGVANGYASLDATGKVPVAQLPPMNTRTIQKISTGTSLGAVAATDYVYLCSAALTATLPTAVGNTNRYTVKRTGTGTVTIATSASQTIDGASTFSLGVQYQSVDLVSDGANWSVI